MKPGLMNDAPTKVLVVEDEAAAARVLVDEVAAAHGFAVAGHTCSGADALRKVVSDDEIDLVLLDIQLPDISGMDVLRRLRAAGCDVDVMAVTVLRDPSMLQAAMALGVVHYLLKPFTAATVRQKLEHYRAFRARRIAAAGHAIAQQEIDELFNALRAMAVDTLPAGIGQETLHAVATQLRRSGAMSAAQVAEILGASRVTARRYLEYLTESGLARRGSRFGGTGRPEVEYRWFGDDASPLPPLPAPDGRPGSST
jgi:response regulator of citrate/malate metabolism